MRTTRTITRFTVVHRFIISIAAILVVSSVSLLATGALASTAKPATAKHRRANLTRPRLAVFSHPLSLRKARMASTGGGVQVPPGAVLAATSSKNAIYAWQPTATAEPPLVRVADNGNSICMVEILSAGPKSIACAPSTVIETRGMISINMPSKDVASLSATALVPNGVTSVTVTDNNASIHTIPVSNNAVIIEDPNLASVSFELPNGGINSASVSEIEASRG